TPAKTLTTKMMIITFSVELFPPNIKINGGNIYVGVALLTSICFTSCHRESLGFVVSWKL
ncbi:hypothetical protein HID58_035793, partial [Brassica napus]